MRYLLDTNIVSYIVKNRYSEKLEQKMRFAVQENLYIICDDRSRTFIRHKDV